MAEAPKPTLDSVLAKAKNKEEIDLTKDELTDLAKDKTVEEARVQLDTRDKLNHLSGELKEERLKHGLEATADNPDLGLAQQLEDVERRIDDHAATLPVAVSDVKPDEPDAPGAKGTLNKLWSTVKNAGAGSLGGVLRALSNIMKIMPNVNLFGVNLQQLNFFEKMYNGLFGSTETREIMEKAMEDAGIQVREGTRDSLAYGKLHTKYERKLREKLGMAADGKTDMSQVEQDLVRQAFTFQAFAKEEAVAYAAANAGPAKEGGLRVTTLMGIAEGAQPLETPPEPKPAEPVAKES